MFLLLGYPFFFWLHVIAASMLTLLEWGAKVYALDSLEVKKQTHFKARKSACH